MKKSMLVSSVIACLSLMTVANAQDKFEAINKDAQIMQNILTTSLKQNTRKDGIRFRKIETGYLAGQGLVFEIYTSSSKNRHFSFDFGHMIENIEGMVNGLDFPEPPPVPDIEVGPESSGNFVFSFEMDEEMEGYIEEVQERTREVMRENRERRRDLREKERDLEWESREYERTIRDLEFEMRHAESERKKVLEKDLKEIRSELEKLDSKKAEFVKKAKELEEEEARREAKLAEAQNQMVNRFLADFEATVAETLCDYGSGLKSLDNSEKLNFVLKEFSRGKGDRSRDELDKVYVFNLKDVKQCVLQQLSPNELLTKTQTYLF